MKKIKKHFVKLKKEDGMVLLSDKDVLLLFLFNIYLNYFTGINA